MKELTFDTYEECAAFLASRGYTARIRFGKMELWQGSTYNANVYIDNNAAFTATTPVRVRFVQ